MIGISKAKGGYDLSKSGMVGGGGMKKVVLKRLHLVLLSA